MLRTLSALIITLSILCNLPAFPAEQPPSGRDYLLERHSQIEGEMAQNHFEVPLYLESAEERNSLRGDVFAVIEHPYEEVQRILREPSNWCDISSLHLNIKACTYRDVAGEKFLIFYSGRKFYQPPEDAYRLTYLFNLLELGDDYLRLSLVADEGPLGTSDYRIEVEAAYLDGDRSLIHFSYAYCFGLSARLAIKGYLATLGADKVGFSVVSRDRHGNPVYVDGTRGLIERNALRYHFAIQAYMDTSRFSEGERFTRRISRWYDLTGRYGRQLFEMGKEEYLGSKRKERLNQLKLQEVGKGDKFIF